MKQQNEEESIEIMKLKIFPSYDESTSQIEPKNLPTELAGSSIVEIMLSRSAPVFYGDIETMKGSRYPFLPLLDIARAFLCRTRKVVFALVACVLSVPYDMPSWLPEHATLLARFVGEPSPVKSTVTKAVVEFRRTHADT
nr:proteasome activator subunit 4 [Tanacetum cinerariifolium]